MENSIEKPYQGTATTMTDQVDKGFSKIEMLLEATGGLSLSQVCAITGLEGSTIQNWVKRGWVARPLGKRYEEIHIARIMIINALKECIKLEHIAKLMSYVNVPSGNSDDVIIKESELYNFLSEALAKMGQADDTSRGGVEFVVEDVIKDYKETNLNSYVRIRKALSLMIYACVCTDVKRRTEAMMKQILHDLEHPEIVEADIMEISKITEEEETPPETESEETQKKTVIQAIREWDTSDISGAPKAIIDLKEESPAKQDSESSEKHSYRPWYMRKGSKR